MTNALQEIEIQSDGGLLRTSPQAILQHFLPGATPYQGSERIYEGHVPGNPQKKCYVQVEALIGMLLEAKEKHLNPLSSMYLIPSNGPDKPASHKIKYSEAVQRARLIPGFLGLNSGLIVRRKEEIVDTDGHMAFPGDTILGAWAELYITNLPRPLRKEISKEEFWGLSQMWSKKGGFMLCKCALDHLLRTNFPTLYVPPEGAADHLQLEAQPPAEPPAASQNGAPPTAPASAPAEPSDGPHYVPDTLYLGTILGISRHTDAEKNRSYGCLKIAGERGGELELYFFSRPDCLKTVKPEEWDVFYGAPCVFSFAEKTGQDGRPWRHVATLDLVDETEPTAEEAAHADA